MAICPRVSLGLNFTASFPVVLTLSSALQPIHWYVERLDQDQIVFSFFSKPLYRWCFVPLPGGMHCLIFGLWGTLQVVSWVFLIWSSESLIAFLIFHMTKHSRLILHIYPRSPGFFYCGKKYLGNRLWVIDMLVASGALIVSWPFQ